ncbi:MAG: polymer-forming cytoskeletal protein [Bacteroidetes bacterium]|nr:MAG: polymer-forming cytoskeletal protein [Bacteroidota bacterium]
MFGNKNENTRPSKVPSSVPKGETRRNIISAGTVVLGNINAEGDLRVEGQVIGTLVCNSKLVVSESGYIEGSVDARNATIEGEIKGNVVTRELLQIDKTGKIFGDIFTQKLVVQMGAIFTGSSKMSDAAKEVLTKTPQRAKDLLAKSSNQNNNAEENTKPMSKAKA